MILPKDILNYVLENEKEFAFLNSLSLHKMNFSIGEITDAVFKIREDKCKLFSKTYDLKLDITDDEIYTAVRNGLYVSAFISRFEERYQVHFLVHQYPTSMKSKFEEEITKDVVKYMIFNTIIALKLDTYEKVDRYMNN